MSTVHASRGPRRFAGFAARTLRWSDPSNRTSRVAAPYSSATPVRGESTLPEHVSSSAQLEA